MTAKWLSIEPAFLSQFAGLASFSARIGYFVSRLAHFDGKNAAL